MSFLEVQGDADIFRFDEGLYNALKIAHESEKWEKADYTLAAELVRDLLSG